ncbi:conserved membrane protein of unknown function (plasmid) [Paraburkholderia kururiensis]|uniref:hypothetical protein n=1 Tax=Paraburkholderia kururiensis TaxID=984307 RepID=UPI0039A4D657
MFGLGLGPSLIIGVIASAVLFHLSPVVTMPVAATLMCLGSFAVSRERRVIGVGFATGCALGCKTVILVVGNAAGTTAVPAFLVPVVEFCSSDGFVIGVCAVSMLLCAFLGIYGPLRWLPDLEFKQRANGH